MKPDADRNSLPPEAATLSPDGLAVDRRTFLGGAAGLTLSRVVAGAAGAAATVLTADDAEAKEIAPQRPIQRRNRSFQVRVQAAIDEKNRGALSHPCNGDEEAFPNRIGNFHKTLPHNSIGEVDPVAYDDLLKGLAEGSFAALEAVPQGVAGAAYLNPLGGLAFTINGPDSPAVAVPEPPPSITSPECAASAAELYWMALLRDVPFAHWNSDPLVAQACADLSGMTGYFGPRNASGQVTPQELFRVAYPGVLEGPIVSQFLLRSFAYDAIPIDPRILPAPVGVDFVTEFNEWVAVQNGGGPAGGNPTDPVLRYPRSVRDLGRIAGADTIYSVYFRAQIICASFGAAARDAANPYVSSTRQGGFSTFGGAHLADLVGTVTKAERNTWYQKWNVHRYLRPEAFGGLVHNVMVGNASYPLDGEILNSAVLPLIFEHNRQQNQARLGINQGSYLLPQMFRRGGPSHPSFPAGHAISAGAGCSVLKAWFNEDFVIPNPVKPSADGLSLLPYVVGVDGPPLTLGGELNKLAHNLSWGRDMSGVHWRADDLSGDFQGEEVVIRLLREERAIYPEPFAGFTLKKFDGTVITI